MTKKKFFQKVSNTPIKGEWRKPSDVSDKYYVGKRGVVCSSPNEAKRLDEE